MIDATIDRLKATGMILTRSSKNGFMQQQRLLKVQVELSHNPEFQDDSRIVIILQQKPQRHIIGEMLQFHSLTICSKR